MKAERTGIHSTSVRRKPSAPNGVLELEGETGFLAFSGKEKQRSKSQVKL